MAKGYFIAHLDISDPEAYVAYRDKAPGTVAQHGGKYLTRGGDMETIEGDALPSRTVVLEFPSVDAARSWYNSPEYQAIIGIRHANAAGFAQIVEGAD